MILTVVAIYSKGEEPFIIAMFTAAGLHAAFKILMAVESCRSIGEDKKAGALEILLVTPASISKFLGGHIFGVNHTLKRLRSCLYAINFFFLAAVLFFPSELDMNVKVQTYFSIIYLGGIGVQVADVWAMGWMALVLGAQKAKPSQAIFAMVARIVLAPWILALLLLFFSIGSGLREREVMTLFCFWFAAAMIASYVFGSRAREKLQGRRFHQLVAEPELPKASNPTGLVSKWGQNEK